ncbi:hypothetical protein GQ42DRAFT_16452 [Ramicandelaber brevisporus]|nr:hypothetical protein GQ42DRAFT_16452 [Ramicandelaber brevisporus]
MLTPVTFQNNKSKPSVFITAGDNYLGYRLAQLMLSPELKDRVGEVTVGSPSVLRTPAPENTMPRSNGEDLLCELKHLGAKVVAYDAAGVESDVDFRGQLQGTDVAVLIPPFDHYNLRGEEYEAHCMIKETESMLRALHSAKIDTLVQWSIPKFDGWTEQEHLPAIDVLQMLETAVKTMYDSYSCSFSL